MTTFKTSHHPELRSGEIFVANMSRKDFSHLGYFTKRLGDHAFDMSTGVPLDANDVFPVFAQQREIEELGFTIEITD